MQEFSTVTASTYDAESLAPLLDAKAADGWSVVSIVAAGSNVVAYLQREAAGNAVHETPAVEAPANDVSTDDAPVEEAAEATSATNTGSDAAPVAAAAVVAAGVDEPAGWATTPDDATDEPAGESIADLGAGAPAAEPAPAEDTAPATESAPVVDTAPVAAPAEPDVAAPAAESTVPAGWYADPSGRFELRYWDANAWTEHVSRSGQQFTDPPVA